MKKKLDLLKKELFCPPMIKMLCDRGVLVYTWLECPKTELDFVHTHCEKFTPFVDCGSGFGHQS